MRGEPTAARRRNILPWTVAAWLLAAIAGLAVLWDYENAPGMAAEAPPRWPDTTTLAAMGPEHRLVIVAHPKCPCTRATMRELERVMAENDGRLVTDVLFTTPPGENAAFHETDLFRLASRIPNVRVHRDDAGVETQRFGAVTSGQALLYGPDGELLFAGGITPGRGHEGSNAGRDAIYALVRDQDDKSATRNVRVFGCSLLDPQAPTRGTSS